MVGQVAAQDLAAAADRRGVASHTPGPSNDAPLQKESYQKQLKRLVNRLKSLAPEGVLLAVLDLANQKLGYHSAPPTTTTTHTPPSLQKLPPRATEKQMRDVLNIMVAGVGTSTPKTTFPLISSSTHANACDTCG